MAARNCAAVGRKVHDFLPQDRHVVLYSTSIEQVAADYDDERSRDRGEPALHPYVGEELPYPASKPLWHRLGGRFFLEFRRGRCSHQDADDILRIVGDLQRHRLPRRTDRSLEQRRRPPTLLLLAAHCSIVSI